MGRLSEGKLVQAEPGRTAWGLGWAQSWKEGGGMIDVFIIFTSLMMVMVSWVSMCISNYQVPKMCTCCTHLYISIVPQ